MMIASNALGHKSIKRIRSNHSGKDLSFSFHSATKDDINKIIQNMKLKTTLGVDNIPTKLVKLASEEVAGLLSYLINKTIINSSVFSTSEKNCFCHACIQNRGQTQEREFNTVQSAS